MEFKLFHCFTVHLRHSRRGKPYSNSEVLEFVVFSKNAISQEAPRTRTKISSADSRTIAEAHRHYGGDDRRIMADARIIETGKTRLQIENHIAYLRKKKNTILSPNQGKRFREEIVEDLEALDVDEEDQSPSQPRSSGDNEFAFSLPEPLAAVDAYDREVLAPAVSSSSVTNVEEMPSAQHRTRAASEVRNTRIHQRTQERAAAVHDIRSERKDMLEHMDRRDSISLMMAQLYKDISRDTELREERREAREMAFQQQQQHQDEIHKAFPKRFCKRWAKWRKRDFSSYGNFVNPLHHLPSASSCFGFFWMFGFCAPR